MAPTKGTDNGQPLALRPHAQARIGEAQTALDAARALLRSTTATIDAAAEASEPVTEQLRARLRAAMSHAAVVARDVLSTCYLLSSSTGTYTPNTIERLHRDGNVARSTSSCRPLTSRSSGGSWSAKKRARRSSDARAMITAWPWPALIVSQRAGPRCELAMRSLRVACSRQRSRTTRRRRPPRGSHARHTSSSTTPPRSTAGSAPTPPTAKPETRSARCEQPATWATCTAPSSVTGPSAAAGSRGPRRWPPRTRARPRPAGWPSTSACSKATDHARTRSSARRWPRRAGTATPTSSSPRSPISARASCTGIAPKRG